MRYVNIPPQARIPSPTRNQHASGALLVSLAQPYWNYQRARQRQNNSILYTVGAAIIRHPGDQQYQTTRHQIDSRKSCKPNMWSSLRVLLEHVPTALLQHI